MNKKYSCIAQKFGVAFVWVCFFTCLSFYKAHACVPMATQPLKAEVVKSYLNDADVAFIGTLTVNEVDESGLKTAFKIEKPIKNISTATYNSTEPVGVPYGCGLYPAGGLWLYFHLPARPLPPELQKKLQLFSHPAAENYQETTELQVQLFAYRERSIFHPLRGSKGILFAEDAALVKELFGYDVAETNVEQPSGSKGSE